MTKITATESAAIVTGHSRGIGESIAEHLLARGARVLGVSRHTNPRLAARFPDTLEEVILDIAESIPLQRWLASDTVERFFAKSDTPLLVNNAGVLQPIGPLETQELERVARAVSINLGAALVLSAAFVQVTADARERRIVHVSSGAARKAYAGWSIYCATKAGLDHHARCVAFDRTPGLLIASVAPGVVDTEMQAEIRASTDERFPDRPRFVALHRDKALPSPDRIGGRLVEYLLSEAFGADPVFELKDFNA